MGNSDIGHEERARDFLVQSSKAILLLNAGAIVATISLFQSMIGAGFALHFKVFAILAALSFFIGTVASVWIMWASYEYADGAKSGKNACRLTGIFAAISKIGAIRGSFLVSVVCFLIGVLIVLAGVMCVVK